MIYFYPTHLHRCAVEKLQGKQSNIPDPSGAMLILWFVHPQSSTVRNRQSWLLQLEPCVIGVVGLTQGWIFWVIWLAFLQSADVPVRTLDPKNKTLTIWLSPIFCRPALESSMGFKETKCSASQNHGVAGFQKWCHFHISCEFCGCFTRPFTSETHLSLHSQRPRDPESWSPTWWCHWDTQYTASDPQGFGTSLDCISYLGSRLSQLIWTPHFLIATGECNPTRSNSLIAKLYRFQAVRLPYWNICHVGDSVGRNFSPTSGSNPEKSELQELWPSSSWYSPAELEILAGVPQWNSRKMTPCNVPTPRKTPSNVSKSQVMFFADLVSTALWKCHW